jgi:hypothetical protein
VRVEPPRVSISDFLKKVEEKEVAKHENMH